MIGSKRIAACAAIALLLLARGALADAPRPLDATMSWQMLNLEKRYRPISQEKFDLLRSALQKGTYAAVSKYQRPRSRQQATETLDAVQIAFVEHNFIQPTGRRGWHDTIGDALEPLQLSPEDRRRLLAPGELNGFRAGFIDRSKPLYFVDDDMAAQLFISVGQRMGWDLRLASGFDRFGIERFYVRWYFAPGEVINWDWRAGSPINSDAYSSIGAHGFYEDWRDRRRWRYRHGLSEQYAYSNYLWLLSRHLVRVADQREMLEGAMQWDPTNENVQNSLAWLYATDPAGSRESGRTAVAYALSALAAAPYDPVIADTAACAYAAARERELAVETEKFAIARLRYEHRDPEVPAYQTRLRQMEGGGRCTAGPLAVSSGPD